MKTARPTSRTHSILVLSASFILLNGCKENDSNVSEPKGSIAVSDEGEGEGLFDITVVHEIRLTMNEAALAQVREDAKNGLGNGHEDTYVEVDLEYDGVQFPSTAIRVKGNSSRSMSTGDYLPFKVDMNRFLDGQQLDGQTKFNLHNGASDSSYLRDYLSYGAWRRADVSASRTGWADVYLNGELLGLYTVVEQVKKKQLERFFDEGNLALYKPESPAGFLSYEGDSIDDYANVGVKSGEDTNHNAFLALVKTLDTLPAAQWETVLDVGSALEYFAGNVALGNWDTYAAMGHNYYLYETEPGRISILPWDMNLSQGTLTGICPLQVDQAVGGARDALGAGAIPGEGELPEGFDPGELPEGFDPGELPEGFEPGEVPSGGGAAGGGIFGGGDAVLHDLLLADESAFANYKVILAEFIETSASKENIISDIDAAVAVLGDRLDDAAVQGIRENIDQRLDTIKSLLDSTTSCTE